MKMIKNDMRFLAIFALLTGFLCAVDILCPQDWAGGKKADYRANTICADKYLIHRPGTTFPSDSFYECCPDTIAGYIGVFWLYPCDTVIDGSDTVITCDSVLFPIRLGIDTLYIGADTIVIADTAFYYQGNGMFFLTDMIHVCETLSLGIDTLTADTSFCIFCDSVMVVTWFSTIGDDTTETTIWSVYSKPANDTCNIVQNSGTRNYHITNIDETVTNIIEGDVYYYSGGWYLDYDGFIRYVEQGDTVRIDTDGISGRNGVWVRGCECDSTLVEISGARPFMRIDTTSWQAFYTERTYTSPISWTLSRSPGSGLDFPYFDDWYYSVKYAEKQGTGKVGIVNFLSHNASSPDIIDTVRARFGASDSLLTDGVWCHPVEAYFCALDSTDSVGSSPAYAVATRRIPDLYCPTFGPAEHLNSATYGAYSALAVRFERTVDFSEMFSGGEIAALTAKQPKWIMIPLVDDIVPYVSINGQEFLLDTIPDYWYSARVHSAQPSFVDYSQPVKVITGVYSCASSEIGLQMVFAFDMADTTGSCWRFTDSLILPDCALDCADTLCFKFPQGWSPTGFGYTYIDTVICFSVCELDTVDLYGYAPMNWLGLLSVSSDSTDTATIKNYVDSLVISADSMKPFISALPIETRQNLTIAKGDSLRFTNASDKGNMNVFTSGDTVFFKAKSDTTVVAIGSGTWYISGTNQWTGGSYVNGDYSMAIGELLNVSADYSIVFGSSNDSIYGDYSLVAGSNHSNITAYSCFVFGNDNDAISGAYSAVWGEGNKLISGEYSTTFGTYNRNYGDNSTVWGQSNKCYADQSTVVGYDMVADSLAKLSFIIGISDSLSSDSTFCSSYPYNELRGQTTFGNGTAIKKIVTVGSHLAIILSSDDTLWAASDTTGF